MAKLSNFSLHLKYCDILFDDLTTRKVIKYLIFVHEQKWENNSQTDMLIKINEELL